MVLQLTSCRDEFEAEVIKGALADMGIECILQGKHMSQIYGGIGAMSVNILVDEKDYDQARAYIDTLEGKEYEAEEAEEKPLLSLWQLAKKNLPTAIIFTVLMSAYELYKVKDMTEVLKYAAFFFCAYWLISIVISELEQRYFNTHYFS